MPDESFISWHAEGRPADMPGRRMVERQAPPHSAQPAPGPLSPWREADLVYCYDGSFAGFLSCVFLCFSRHEFPFAIWPDEQERTTLYPVEAVPTDPARADRVFRGYCRLMGGDGRRLLMTAFLSGEPDKELVLLRFLRLSFQEGPRTLALLGHADVAPVYALDKAIGRETEHLMGFVRFEENNGMLASVIHPKNHVLPLLRGHFCGRFPDETFLIYDANHHSALLHQNHHAELLQLAQAPVLPPADEKEQYYQALWKQFYRTLAIEPRRNEALRRQMCPKRFWGDMTELQDER